MSTASEADGCGANPLTLRVLSACGWAAVGSRRFGELEDHRWWAESLERRAGGWPMTGLTAPRLSQDERGGVVGPCPGCSNWTLEDNVDELHLVVEGIVREHAAECWPLTVLIGTPLL